MKTQNNNEEITVFFRNQDFMTVDSIKCCNFCGKKHYLCLKGKTKIYIPFGKLDFIRIEPPDDEDTEEKSPVP